MRDAACQAADRLDLLRLQELRLEPRLLRFGPLALDDLLGQDLVGLRERVVRRGQLSSAQRNTRLELVVCLLDRGERPALALDEQRRLQRAAQLLLQLAVDPAEPRADLEQRKAELPFLKVEGHGHHARRVAAPEPRRRSELPRAKISLVGSQLPSAAGLLHEQRSRPRFRILLRLRVVCVAFGSVSGEIAARDAELGQLVGEDFRQLVGVMRRDQSAARATDDPIAPRDVVVLVVVQAGRQLADDTLDAKPEVLDLGRRVGDGVRPRRVPAQRGKCAQRTFDCFVWSY